MQRLAMTLIAFLIANLDHDQRAGDRRRPERRINRVPRGSYAGTSFHPIRTELRQNRAANAARNFYTGHWQHRTVKDAGRP
jgi:hypothetical protein